jgi:hypothetical protein
VQFFAKIFKKDSLSIQQLVVFFAFFCKKVCCGVLTVSGAVRIVRISAADADDETKRNKPLTLPGFESESN